ncbi:TonB-dependent receptor [Acanthopleuribacter pedis]|uniref:TonB-dependent receptor n=1 Tax=Acanthopleuribacter pedis TaxID=442870 RepID=A0A8J7QAM5_9BACT|nr:TonB-dependent receptor [Acanthopleuribacter pedis]MBO1321931.1 TonB-dependent receptor [Acanthopleuribacter pedis]
MKPSFSHTLIRFCLAGLFAAACLGQETELETIVVIGNKETTTDAGRVGSVDVVGQEEITSERVDDTLELFNKVPGVYLSRYNQGLINTDVAIRGFAGDGSSPHAKLLIDGIPVNLHNGYNELDQLFPLNIESIAVFKGTSDPRYGLFNTAGNYEALTRQDDARELEVSAGSFNTGEVQGYLGLTHGALKQNYAFGYRTSDGYRDHTDLEKTAVSGSWTWALDDTASLRILARHGRYDGDAPGYLDRETARANPRSSAVFANQDGGDKATNHLSVHWSKAPRKEVLWSLKAYGQTFERERWVRFSEAGSLQNRYDDQTHFGMRATLNWALNERVTLDWGFDHERQDNVEQRFGTVGQERVRDANRVIRDFQYDFNATGMYLKLSHEPNARLRWNLALRADQLDGDFSNQNSGEGRDMYDFGTIVQPKLNLVYAATEQVNLFVNMGRGFQHPFGSSAYTAGDRGARDVSLNDGYELGGQWRQGQQFTLRLSHWNQTATDEFVVVDGTARNVGETERNGFDLALNGRLSRAVSFWGSYTTIDSEIVKTSDADAAFEGNELRSIPDYTASLGFQVRAGESLNMRLHLDAQGDYQVNEANLGGSYGGFTLLNASADYAAGWGTIKLHLHNITDEYYEYVYDFSMDGGATIHSPGDGFSGGLSLAFDF